MAGSSGKVETAARAKMSQDYSNREDGKEGVLTTRVEVQNESAYRCCIFVEARFSLRMEDEKQGRNIGRLYAYIVDTKAKDEKGKSLFLSEMLTTTGDDRGEVEKVMQTMFTKTGNVRALFKAHRDDLTEDRLLYIDTLTLQKKYRGKGLVQLAMDSFHELMPTLADLFAFSGTVILSPAPSEDFKSKNRTGKSDIEIEAALIASYEKSNYEVWLKGAEDMKDSVTVMGRRIS